MQLARRLLTPAPDGPIPSGAWSLAVFRCVLGVWLAAAAVFCGHFSGPLGYSDVASAIIVVALSLAALRYPYMRLVIVPISVWIGASTFILDGASQVSYLNEVILGKTLLFVAIASHEMFEE